MTWSCRRPVLGALAALAVLAAATVGSPSRRADALSGDATSSLGVDPATDLVDGQAVSVTGSGFRPGETTVFQCRTELRGPAECDLGTANAVTVDDDGRFSVDQRVFATIYDGGGATVDCRVPGSCVLAADVGFDGGASAVVAPIAFDPDGAMLPPPSVTVSPATDLVDRQVVHVEGQGFVHRQSEILIEDESIEVNLYQCSQEPFGPPEDCPGGPVTVVELDDDGTFSADVPVSTLLVTRFSADVDCRASTQPCILAASISRHPGSPLAGRAELHFDPDGALPDWPAPEVVVTPGTEGLHDFNELTVQGTAFSPGGDVEVAMCQAGLERCDFDTIETPTADAAGEVEVDIDVVPTFSWFDGDVDCRAAPGCVLHVIDKVRDAELVVPLTFGPPDPPRGRYLDPVFDEVEQNLDIVYRETVDSQGRPVQLKLDIFRPVGDPATSRPAVVLMHGGFFAFGDKASMHADAIELATRGYVGVSLQYRLRSEALFSRHEMFQASLDAYDDAVAGVEWLQDHAGEYGIDPEAIMAGGFSAGAVTASNLAYLPGQRGPATPAIAAAAPQAGMIYTPPEPGDPPTLFHSGTLDTITPYDNVADMCALAEQADPVCEVVTASGGGHGDGGPAFTRRTADFFAEHALKPQGYFDVQARAGGPYEVDEGSDVMLDATGSTGEDLSYSWSPAERVHDPTSPQPQLTGVDDGVETLQLTVTSNHGITSHAQAEVTTHNVAPAVGDVETATSGELDVALTVPVTDPGLADTHTAQIDWGDGHRTQARVEQGSGSATVHGQHTYPEPGSYVLTVTVMDDDGGQATTSATAAVGCTIVGTPGDDRLVGTVGDDVICGLGGDDRIRGRSGDDRIFGGPGDDRLMGGSGDDHIAGGPGDDRLRGGRGDDDHHGGPGYDRAYGGPGHDSCETESRRSCSAAQNERAVLERPARQDATHSLL